MKFKTIFPLAFGLLLTSFATFSVLETLVIEDINAIDVSDDEDDIVRPEELDKKDDKEPTNDPVDDKKDPVDDKKDDENPPSDDKKDDENPPDSGNKDENPPVTTGFKGNLLDSYEAEGLSINVYTEYIKCKHMQSDEMMDTYMIYADIKTTDVLTHMRVRFARDKFGRNITENTSSIAARVNAVFAINGDYYGAQERGYVLRNQKIYRNTVNSKNREDLVIYNDGSFDTFYEKDVSLETVQNQGTGAFQVFSFGPALVKNSQISVEKDDEVALFNEMGNQRMAIGYYEPGHYLVACCDGRLPESYGMSLYEMGAFMQQYGVKTCYNLDGGGSTTMYFKGKVINRPNSNGPSTMGERAVSDILYFR